MPLPAAPTPHVFLLIVLVGATASAATASVPAGDATTVFTNGTAAPGGDDDNTEMYICYLCTGRDPLLIRYCPIYWDECHLVCYGDESAAAIPATPAPAPPSSLGPAHPSGVGDEECYVMKLYHNASYTIVNRLGCAQIARCLLSCGGGDMADRNRNALGAATTTTTVIQGSFPPPSAEDFQRCGTQVTAPRAPSSAAAAVPAGGARRRR